MALKKILWAIEAFEPDRLLNRNTAHILSAIVQKTGAIIEPVYLLNIRHLEYSQEVARAWLPQLKRTAYSAMQKILSDVEPIVKTLEPRILVGSSGSVMGSSELLSNDAISHDADLIAVGTHGRTGVRRFLLGSFAESFLRSSWVSVLVTGYQIFRPPALSQILFPTPLNAASRQAFREAVKVAQALNASLVVFHCSTHSVEPLLQSGVSLLGGTWLPLYPYLGHERNQVLRRASVWKRWAKAKNIPVDFIIQARGEPIATSILQFAHEKKPELLIIESQSGPLSSVVVGSITREVIRHAPCAVWVLRPCLGGEKELGAPLEMKRSIRFK